MASLTSCNFTPAIACPLNSKNSTFFSSNFTKLNTENGGASFFPRLRSCQLKATSPKRSYRLLAVSGFADGDSETNPEAESSDSNAGAAIDIKLPRRSLLVQFTCNECGERTKRLINRLAYEKGLVFVQCAGCEQYHKLSDNLGLIVEYDLRDEVSTESNTDQVE